MLLNFIKKYKRLLYKVKLAAYYPMLNKILKLSIFFSFLLLEGCLFFGGEDQEMQYKKIFQEKRRPVYNPGGPKFKSQSDFYNSYMKKNHGIIPSIKKTTTTESNKQKTVIMNDVEIERRNFEENNAVMQNKRQMSIEKPLQKQIPITKLPLQEDRAAIKSAQQSSISMSQFLSQKNQKDYEKIKKDILKDSSSLEKGALSERMLEFDDDKKLKTNEKNSSSTIELVAPFLQNEEAKLIQLKKRKPDSTLNLKQNKIEKTQDEIESIVNDLYNK